MIHVGLSTQTLFIASKYWPWSCLQSARYFLRENTAQGALSSSLPLSSSLSVSLSLSISLLVQRLFLNHQPFAKGEFRPPRPTPVMSSGFHHSELKGTTLKVEGVGWFEKLNIFKNLAIKDWPSLTTCPGRAFQCPSCRCWDTTQRWTDLVESFLTFLKAWTAFMLHRTHRAQPRHGPQPRSCWHWQMIEVDPSSPYTSAQPSLVPFGVP